MDLIKMTKYDVLISLTDSVESRLSRDEAVCLLVAIVNSENNQMSHIHIFSSLKKSLSLLYGI
jgi:hypothetical protein